MPEPEEVREHETTIEIDAPVEDVWKAITEPGEIERWFAPKMTVEPHIGGTVVADWGPTLEWKTTVEVWEPNRHLRLVETRDRILGPAGEQLEPRRLVQDYFLEAKGGKTILRFVHSGFGTSRGWDIEYEGTKGGWASCFLRLKHALERHRLDSVHNFIVTAVCYGIDYAQAMRQIADLVPRPFDVALRGHYHLTGLLPDLNGSIVTISVQPSSMGSVAYVECALYGLPDGRAAAIQNDWRTRLARLFPISPEKATSPESP